MGLFRGAGKNSLAPDALGDALASGAALIDVRTAGEWRVGHLPAATHIPLDDLGQRLSELDPARLTVVVCRSGNRSGFAVRALHERGYRVANLVGGMAAMRRAGSSIVRDDGSPGSVA